MSVAKDEIKDILDIEIYVWFIYFVMISKPQFKKHCKCEANLMLLSELVIIVLTLIYSLFLVEIFAKGIIHRAYLFRFGILGQIQI